mmetsp:Transcript_2961/g.9564  ORF Transcript_2961/g.9564 Transcript_2961/m.9564 type:complete len:236 (-) Transcript_2961:69-776(-)
MSAVAFAAVPNDVEPSDLEELLSEGAPQAGRPWRRRAALAALAMGALGLAAAAALRPAPAAAAPAQGPWANVEEVIRASALEELGRAPTTLELDTFKKHAASSGVLQVPLRQLAEPSDECKEAFMKMMKAALKKIGRAIFKALMACVADNTTDACKSAQEDLKGLDGSLKEDCKKSESSDLCNATITTKEGTENEHACIPKACQDELEDLTETLQEKECAKFKEEDECEATLTCA